MKLKIGNIEATVGRTFSFEGGTIDSAPQARVFADALHRWAETADGAAKNEENERDKALLVSMLEQFFSDLKNKPDFN